MGVISFSASEADEKLLEKACKAAGAKNRSQAIRRAIGALVNQLEPLEKLSGTQTVVITLSVACSSPPTNAAAHELSQMTRFNSSLHTNGGCVQVLVLEGEAAALRQAFRKLSRLKHVKKAGIMAV